MQLGPGLYDDVSHEAYHADPCKVPSLSASMAGILISSSPRHAWQAHPRLGGRVDEEDTDATDRGTVVHKLLLGRGPDVVEVEANDWRSKVAKEARDAARAAGRVPVLVGRMTSYRTAADALRSRLLLSGVEFEGGRPEVTVVWESDGVLCRARMDYLTIAEGAALIDDLKTADSANPAGVGAKMVSYGGDIQAAAYIEAIETLMPECAGRVRIRFAYGECRPPYEASVNVPDGVMLELGRRKWKRAKELWRACSERDEWPGYSTEIQRATPPPWALSEDMQRQEREMGNNNADVAF